MRPLKLVMTAFGPYAGKEEIDFTILEGRNIFLITGPTGAGKTTIFDAISYALYGDPSGEDRDGESLRSHFAGIETLTSVELEFELRGKRYCIKRIPKQEKKKLRGEGTSEQKSDAEFYIMDDENTQVVSGVQSVNERINSILGINHQQFKQIMMIPQGEFRKLLTSDSKDREKILQKIFGTEGYKAVEYRLSEMEGKIRKDVEGLKGKIAENINMVDTAQNETLKLLVGAENNNISEIIKETEKQIHMDDEAKGEIEKASEELNSELENKQKEIVYAEENNKKFKTKEELENKKLEMEGKKLEIESKTLILQNARKALNIKSSEEGMLKSEKTVGLRRSELEKSEEVLSKAQRRFQETQAEYEKENSREPERQKLFEKSTVIKGYVDKVKGYDQRRSSLLNAEKAAGQKEEEINVKKQHVSVLKEKIKTLETKIEEGRKAETEFVKLSSNLEKMKDVHDKFERLKEENKVLVLVRDEYKTAKKRFDDSGRIYEEEKNKYDKMQELFLKGQAGLIAQTLVEGSPCPVCGSLHHPKAAVHQEGTPGEEQIKIQKRNLDKAEENLRQCREAFHNAGLKGTAQKEKVENIKADLNNLLDEDILSFEKDELTQFVKDRLLGIEREKAGLEVAVTKLNDKVSSVQEIINTLENMKKSLIDEESLIENLNNEYTLLHGSLESQRAILNQLDSEIPQEIRSEKALYAAIEQIENEYNRMLRAFKLSEQSYKNAQLSFAEVNTSRAAGEKALNESKLDMEEAKHKFELEVIKAGFKSKEEYNSSKLSDSQIEALDNYIKSYNEDLKSVRDRYEEALKNLEGVSVIDTEKLKIEHEEIKLKMSDLNVRQREIYSRINRNKEALSRIEELYRELERREKEYSIVGDLAQAAKGNNRAKITFERYVLAAFFDNIIKAANLRLAKMTANRFVLHRVEERSKGNAQSGLELEVFDNYTGRFRHVKTLSGGESFKASLAMALGLADVVQSYAGGISLDTMFIDEGFGTLDPESLDGAIECLLDLQNAGRLVGIISHVPELKERVEARLEIVPSVNGSVSKFHII